MMPLWRATRSWRWAAFDRSDRCAVIVRNLRTNYETLYSCAALGARRRVRSNRQLRAGCSGTINGTTLLLKKDLEGCQGKEVRITYSMLGRGQVDIINIPASLLPTSWKAHKPARRVGRQQQLRHPGALAITAHADPPDRKHCSRKAIDCPHSGQRQPVDNSRGVTASMVDVCGPTRRFRAITKRDA